MTLDEERTDMPNNFTFHQTVFFIKWPSHIPKISPFLDLKQKRLWDSKNREPLHTTVSYMDQ